MEQQTAAVAASTLPRHALRALLLLGGAVLWWLVFLSGGAAHADDNGIVTQGSSAAIQEAVQAADAPGLLDRATHRVSGTLRESPALLTTTLTGEAASAPAPVVATVQTLTTTLAPRLSLASDAVADRLDSTVGRADAVLTPTLHRAGLDAPRKVATTRTAVTHRGLRDATSRATVGTSDVQSSAWSAPLGETLGQAASSSPAGNGDGLPTGSVPPAPAMPGSGSTGGPASAAMFGALALMLPARRTRRLGDVAAAGSRPAFPPGSSPD
jgi:hypothetical protein